MKTDQLVKYAGYAFIVYILFNQASNYIYNQFQVGDIKMKFDGLNFDRIRARLFIPVKNLTAVSVPIQSMTGTLFYGQYALSTLAITSPLTIQAEDTTILQINVDIDSPNFVGQIIDLVQTGNYFGQLRVKGVLRSADINIPFDQPISLA